MKKEVYKSRVYTDRPDYADFDAPQKFEASYKDFYLSRMQPPPINNLIQATIDMKKQFKRFTNGFICTATEAFNELSKSISEVIQC